MKTLLTVITTFLVFSAYPHAHLLAKSGLHQPNMAFSMKDFTVGTGRYLNPHALLKMSGGIKVKEGASVIVHDKITPGQDPLKCQKGKIDIQVHRFVVREKGISRLILAHVCRHAIYNRLVVLHGIPTNEMLWVEQQGFKFIAGINYILRSKITMHEKEKELKRFIETAYNQNFERAVIKFMQELNSGKKLTDVEKKSLRLESTEFRRGIYFANSVINTLFQFNWLLHVPNKRSARTVFALLTEYAQKDSREMRKYISQNLQALFSLEIRPNGIEIIKPRFSSVAEIPKPDIKILVEVLVKQMIKRAKKKYYGTHYSVTHAYQNMDYRTEYLAESRTIRDTKMKYGKVNVFNSYIVDTSRTESDKTISTWYQIINRDNMQSRIETFLKKKIEERDRKQLIFYVILVFGLLFIILIVRYIHNEFTKYKKNAQEKSQKEKEERDEKERIVNLYLQYSSYKESLTHLYDKRKHRKKLSERMRTEIDFFLTHDASEIDEEDIENEVHALSNCIATIENINAVKEKSKREKVPESSLDHQHQKNLQRAENEKLIGEVEDLLKDAKNRGILQPKFSEIIKNHNDPKFRPSKVKHALLNLKSEIDI